MKALPIVPLWLAVYAYLHIHRKRSLLWPKSRSKTDCMTYIILHDISHLKMWAWHLVWAWQRHHDVLLLDVAPAVEDREDREEEEDVSPLEQEVVGVERLQQARGHDAEDEEVEGQPGDQEHAVPVPQPVTSQTGGK